MGLDLVVEGSPKAGYEAEWREILARSFRDGEAAEGDEERFREISIPPFERVGAPRVGFDRAADDWIIEASNAGTPDQVAEVLKEMHGYHVLRLVECDGLPKYTHGGLYDGVDETSFRGKFLEQCGDVLPQNLIAEAWEHRFPEEAVSYGQALLAAANAASTGQPEEKPGLLSRLGFGKKQSSSAPLEEQLDIVQAAGKWFIYWGERGHAIRAWF